MLFPIKLIDSLLKSRRIIRNFSPDVAVGTGGYASAPLLKVASHRGIPCLIQEQNSHAGITNKWLAGKVHKICVAYPGMERFFPEKKIVFTGNPVRQDLLEIDSKREEALKYFNLDNSKRTLLVIGGSLGAGKINERIERSMPFFAENELQVIWQCGKYYEKKYMNKGNGLVQVHTFLNRMDLAYAASDIIVSRAGAISVSELCLVGKPVLFIPSPNVAEDHQTKNAMSIVNMKAAIMLKENELDEKFEIQISHLLMSKEIQEELSENIKKLAKPNAAKDIVAEIEKLLQLN